MFVFVNAFCWAVFVVFGGKDSKQEQPHLQLGCHRAVFFPEDAVAFGLLHLAPWMCIVALWLMQVYYFFLK